MLPFCVFLVGWHSSDKSLNTWNVAVLSVISIDGLANCGYIFQLSDIAVMSSRDDFSSWMAIVRQSKTRRGVHLSVLSIDGHVNCEYIFQNHIHVIYCFVHEHNYQFNNAVQLLVSKLFVIKWRINNNIAITAECGCEYFVSKTFYGAFVLFQCCYWFVVSFIPDEVYTLFLKRSYFNREFIPWIKQCSI